MKSFNLGLKSIFSAAGMTAFGLTAMAVATLLTSIAQAYPAQVVIVRHGEKVTDKETELSEQGQERARGLVGFMSNNPEMIRFGAPVAVYASRPKEDHSTRAMETATPLADALNQSVRLEFGKGEEKDLARSVMMNPQYNHKTVFIAWVHDEIPDLAHAFGLKKVPDWDGKVFDRAWVIRFMSNGDIESAQEYTQNVLPSDTPYRAPIDIGKIKN